MHKNSKLLFEKHAARFFSATSRVLEIGPDRHPSTYHQLLKGGVAAWETLDAFPRTDVPLTHLASSEYDFPVASDSYDVVFSAQVIEHVRKIWRWMPELARVCRPGGYVVTINPVSWHYHESPVDCWRIYPEGMRALSEDSGLEVELSEWESVEFDRFRGLTPRRLRKHHLLQRLSGTIGIFNAGLRIPVEAAFDTITVARKPGGTGTVRS